MFAVSQIKAAHSKVKTGADFPQYIQEIKTLGVTAFETWVIDSHTVYFGKNDFQTQSQPMYENLSIAVNSDKERFTHCLKMHQQGETDYTTFCKDCADTGIEKWYVSLEKMTCTYFDKEGHEILIEKIPG